MYENNNAKLSHSCNPRLTSSSSSDSSSSELSDSDSDESFSIPNNTKIYLHDDRKRLPISHPRKKCSGLTFNRRVSAPSINQMKMSTRTSTKASSNSTNLIVIEEQDNYNDQLDTTKNSCIYTPFILDPNYINSAKELSYFIKWDSRNHPPIHMKEIYYLNNISEESFYPQIYDDRNCAIYASLLKIKQLLCEVIKYKKPKK